MAVNNPRVVSNEFLYTSIISHALVCTSLFLFLRVVSSLSSAPPPNNLKRINLSILSCRKGALPEKFLPPKLWCCYLEVV